ncbi:hypothetical protein FA95DRAFT_26645 [Auriscalpium vulgare]|uniref:Uncharacterized protein n=1 Tax=Auriscalpium vulgare TaxID=40419 RepID=A0ACB8SC11_9AGAM|nr:hypothetical protein FA95DRAFT_26645 [Auriscalpium vulgare]
MRLDPLFLSVAHPATWLSSRSILILLPANYVCGGQTQWHRHHHEQGLESRNAVSNSFLWSQGTLDLLHFIQLLQFNPSA